MGLVREASFLPQLYLIAICIYPPGCSATHFLEISSGIQTFMSANMMHGVSSMFLSQSHLCSTVLNQRCHHTTNSGKTCIHSPRHQSKKTATNNKCDRKKTHLLPRPSPICATVRNSKAVRLPLCLCTTAGRVAPRQDIAQGFTKRTLR
eukprot:5373084-Amphidinium_carterae.1